MPENTYTFTLKMPFDPVQDKDLFDNHHPLSLLFAGAPDSHEENMAHIDVIEALQKAIVMQGKGAKWRVTYEKIDTGDD
jgi:hypothetical protein